jgi:sialidase-1
MITLTGVESHPADECYKIPTLLKIPNSTHLLSFVEARRFSCSDSGWIDIVQKTSVDDGRTWGSPQLVVSDPWLRSNTFEWHTIGDALPVFDRVTQRIHLIFTRDNEDAFITHSDDLGASWSRPTNISSLLPIKQRGPFCGTGHSAGLQLSHPSGRLVVPMYCQGNALTQTGGGSFAILSDDHGQSWRTGGLLGKADGNEWVAAEVGDPTSGRLLGSLRSEQGSRLQAYSDDAGETWSEPAAVPVLPEPISGCEASLTRHPNGRLYYAHPDSSILRQMMTVKVSADSGQSWAPYTQIWGPKNGCVPPCVPAASYSSLAVLGDDKDAEIAILYMRNNATMLIFEGRGVTYTTFAP